MSNPFVTRFTTLAMLAGALFLAGCAKKQAKATPPAPAPPPTPTASLTATPADIQQGQSAQLSWNTSNATEINISGLGTVSASGTQAVNPDDSTTYELTAKGPGGTADASARVTVTPKPAPVQSSLSEDQLFQQNVKDVFFDFNKYDIRPDQESIAQADAKFLADHPDMSVTVAGHCDDRGSEEYNLALGESRANSFKNELVKDGVSADRIKTVSLGKEQPFCSDNTEQCWQQNRRDH
ncbi:MAG TPA: peptidoglycan-associated lipoprotein Pal, partial [Terriglobales bacterium]|nr:peptidoglycan-associated lipoprotein Pal [Terriglobales bacterium]